MPLEAVPFEIRLMESENSLGLHALEISPVPGMEIWLDGQLYLVMERCHRYALRMNRYELSGALLWVKAIHNSLEKTWHEGQWILGNLACRYNARSPLIRCAVNPEGPCDRCPSFQAIEGPQ